MIDKKKDKDSVSITGDRNIVTSKGASEIKQTNVFGDKVTGAVHTGSGSINIWHGSDVRTMLSEFESSKDLPREQYFVLFKQLSNYLLRSLPSDLEVDIILQIESVLNDAYNHAYREGWYPRLTDAILEALSLSSSLSDVAKRQFGSSYGADYFKTAKKLGQMLDLISALH